MKVIILAPITSGVRLLLRNCNKKNNKCAHGILDTRVARLIRECVFVCEHSG